MGVGVGAPTLPPMSQHSSWEQPMCLQTQMVNASAGPPRCARSQLTAGTEIQGVWSAPPPKLKYRGGQKAYTVLKGSRRMENISYPRGPPQEGVRSSSLEGPITKRTALLACFVRKRSEHCFPSIPLPPANCSRGTCPRKSQLHRTRAQSAPPPLQLRGISGHEKK